MIHRKKENGPLFTIYGVAYFKGAQWPPGITVFRFSPQMLSLNPPL